MFLGDNDIIFLGTLKKSMKLMIPLGKITCNTPFGGKNGIKSF